MRCYKGWGFLDLCNDLKELMALLTTGKTQWLYDIQSIGGWGFHLALARYARILLAFVQHCKLSMRPPEEIFSFAVGRMR